MSVIDKPTKKTLDNKEIKEEAKATEFGGKQPFTLLYAIADTKAKFRESVHAMQAGNGCIVKTTITSGNNVSVALCFAANTSIKKKNNGELYLG